MMFIARTQPGYHRESELYLHIGLEELAAKENETALGIDPNSDRIKVSFVTKYFLSKRSDEGLEASKRLLNRDADLRYYLDKRMVKESKPLVEQAYQQNPGDAWVGKDRALLLALQGKHQEAQAAIPSILGKAQRDRMYHDLIYEIARIYALSGKSEEALKWLRVTVKEGYPQYPLFLRDSFLDPIRKDPAFIQFLAEMKTRWEGYQREFG